MTSGRREAAWISSLSYRISVDVGMISPKRSQHWSVFRSREQDGGEGHARTFALNRNRLPTTSKQWPAPEIREAGTAPRRAVGWCSGSRDWKEKQMDVTNILSALHLELEQIEHEIRFLEQFDAGIESRPKSGPGLSVRELERFLATVATTRRARWPRSLPLPPTASTPL